MGSLSPLSGEMKLTSPQSTSPHLQCHAQSTFLGETVRHALDDIATQQLSRCIVRLGFARSAAGLLFWDQSVSGKPPRLNPMGSGGSNGAYQLVW